MKNYVAYVRVSTKHQIGNHSFEAQINLITSHMKEETELIYHEQDSGSKANRTQLKLALAEAKSLGVPLVVAFLDRFARNVKFMLEVIDSGADIIFCDFPNGDRMTLTVLMAVAEYHNKQTSEKVKRGLEIARAKGKQIGSPQNLTPEARLKSAFKLKADAYKRNKTIGSLILDYKKRGESFLSICRILNEAEYLTPMGSKFYPQTVKRLYERYKN